MFEEKDIPAAIRRAEARIVKFRAISSDRLTPGDYHLPWRACDAGLNGQKEESKAVASPLLEFQPNFRIALSWVSCRSRVWNSCERLRRVCLKRACRNSVRVPDIISGALAGRIWVANAFLD